MRIRAALDFEAPLLTAVARASKASWGYPEAWLHEWRDELHLTPEYIEAHRVLVAEAGGALVGMVALEEDGEEAELAHLWVLPGQQGQGVGRALVERALELARYGGHGSVRVESDPNAEPFYLRLGAERIGEVPAPVGEARRRSLPLLRIALDPA